MYPGPLTLAIVLRPFGACENFSLTLQVNQVNIHFLYAFSIHWYIDLNRISPEC